MIQDRKSHPTEKQDLLNIMLNGVDNKTGKGLSDENIRFNVSYFLQFWKITPDAELLDPSYLPSSLLVRAFCEIVITSVG